MKIFKKIKCKFAVKDEVRLLSLKVIHYPNIALHGTKRKVGREGCFEAGA